MSYTFTLTGDESVLTAQFNPPLFLDPQKEYVMGLTSFETFNAIPNITSENNILKFNNRNIIIPEGSYEINDLNDYIQSKLRPNEYISIKANYNTLHTEIKSTHVINFDVDNSIGPLLGFRKRILASNKFEESDHPANVITVNSLLIECNITTGNFKNGNPAHVIYQFFPNVPPGFKIVECPSNVIYLPINVKTITHITIQIMDQNGFPVSFRKEAITIGLHLKAFSNGASI